MPVRQAGGAAAPGDTAGTAGGRRAVTRLEVGCVAVLVALPLLWFGIPALLGHPVLSADNLNQNLPLRELVGRQLRSGTFPSYDPYIWSGAPLLGGWNAGAMYPFTWLFAVLPTTAAWVLNQMVVYWTAALGLYAFLRSSRLGPVASGLGGATFAFSGAMATQLSHFGLVAGVSWIPLMLLGVRWLSVPSGRRGRWSAAVALCGVAGGLCILAGEPRAVDEAVVVVGGYALWRLVRVGRHGLRPYLGGLAAAGLLVFLLGAAQWAPGLPVVHTSQRAVAGFTLFQAGSLPPRWLTLLLVPDLLGGSGAFGQQPFFGSYNLPEVTGYVGLLPLAAALALLARFRFRRPLPEWTGWMAIALVGLVLALGGDSPLGHLLSQLPAFGSQRLQSRNLLVADVALAVLLAYWVDGVLAGDAGGAVDGAPAPGRRRWSQVAASAAPVAVVVTVLAVVLWPGGVATWLGSPAAAGAAAALWPSVLPFLGVALAVLAVVWVAPRLPARWRAPALVAVAALDLCAFTLTVVVNDAAGQYWSPLPTAATSGHSGPGGPGHTGRYAIYDPLLTSGSPLPVASTPDGNLLTSQYSAQGYSALVDGTYAAATGSHQASGFGTNALTPAAIGNGVLDQLDTTTLFTSGAYLVVPGTATTSGAGVRTVADGGSTTWWVGTPMALRTADLPVLARHGHPRATVTVVAAGGPGAVHQVVLPGAGGGPAVPGVPGTVGLRVTVHGGGATLGAPVLTGALRDFVADGVLQQGDVLAHWSYAGTSGNFAAFANHAARPPLTVRDPGATVRRTGGPRLDPTAARVTSPAGATVVRAVAAIPGWTASWTADGGTTTTLPVRRQGVVQAVRVPAGRGTLRWHYQPPGLELGVWLSLLGLAALAAVVAWSARRRVRGAGPPAVAAGA